MNVASKELCQELYELSGWGNTHNYYNGSFVECREELMFDDAIPAYDLGYLLRKLPQVTLKHVALDSDDLNRWFCSIKSVSMGYHGETPEDAACKLAIELFKKGVLSRDQ